MNRRRNKTSSKGIALLVVLFVIMTVTILSLGFLARSDVELACGGNMVLRTQMDCLAQSGLEHARGLILNPQDVVSEYWTGAARQQLVSGSDDYYDVAVVKTGQCNYQISSDAYREKGVEKIGQSSLTAELRLNPCIALRVGNEWVSEQKTTINGDVYCNGNLKGLGSIRGDAFARGDITALNVLGQKNHYITQPPVNLPGLRTSDFSSNYCIETSIYSVQIVDANIPTGTSLNPSGDNPAGVFYRGGDVKLSGNVNISGMLVVSGDLKVSGAGNVVTAVKNFPALLIGGELIMEDGGTLTVNGLAQVGKKISVKSKASNVHINVVGSLFIVNGNIDGLGSSASSTLNVTAAPDKAAIEVWPTPGNAVRWSPAAGAFFRSIRRK